MTKKGVAFFGTLSLLIVLMMSGCASKEEARTDEVSIFYKAGDGSFMDGSEIYDIASKEAEKSEDEKNEKIHVTLYNGGRTATGIMSYLVAAFNRDNDTYQIDMKRFSGDEVFAAQDRLKAELSTGGGPDVMTFDVIPDAPLLMGKDVFVDLAGLMEKSEMSAELYFPAFRSLKSGDKVYGMCPSVDVVGMTVRREVIGDGGIPDLETFVDELLNYPKDAIFINSVQDGNAIMKYFLCGSDDLWGMIDWENRKCDFNGELFSKILDVSKRYGDAAKKGYEPLMQCKYMYVGLCPGEDAFKNDGWETIDFYFDDGNYPRYNLSYDTLFINANTEKLEGAWAFMSYCMTVSGQSICGNPVQKAVFDQMRQKELERLENGTEYMTVDLTEKSVLEMKNVFESGRYASLRTSNILRIIEEEAGAFFSGDKSKQETIRVIQNKVQLLLNE